MSQITNNNTLYCPCLSVCTQLKQNKKTKICTLHLSFIFKNTLRSTTVSSQGMRMINSEAMSVLCSLSRETVCVCEYTQSRPIVTIKSLKCQTLCALYSMMRHPLSPPIPLSLYKVFSLVHPHSPTMSLTPPLAA